MKERPILFSAPMVRAILAVTKTQTRRVVKDKHLTWVENITTKFWEGEWDKRPFPYGEPGDRLWVRETWAPNNVQPPEHRPPVDYLYAATDSARYAVCRWRPSIHMPRAVSRITLEVTGARVERLQDISEADALAEGLVQQRDGGFGLPAGEHYHATDPRISYWSLWDHINGAGSVEANPWVWVVEFKRLEAAK